VAVYAYRQPVIAATGAVLVLDEPVGIRLVICGGVVLAGVWFAARSR
jgi:drug/metabolite transporter (DMT)-like permease